MTEKKNGVIQVYYNEAVIQLTTKYFIFNGKYEGEYKISDRDGQLKVINNFINNKVEGEYKIYHDNGQLQEICQRRGIQAQFIHR